MLLLALAVLVQYTTIARRPLYQVLVVMVGRGIISLADSILAKKRGIIAVTSDSTSSTNSAPVPSPLVIQHHQWELWGEEWNPPYPLPALLHVLEIQQEVLQLISMMIFSSALLSLSFLGPGHFRYGPFACKMFLQAYLTSINDEWIDEKKVTNAESVTTSISCTRRYFNDKGTDDKDLTFFLYNAAKYGRIEKMEWVYQLSTRLLTHLAKRS